MHSKPWIRFMSKSDLIKKRSIKLKKKTLPFDGEGGGETPHINSVFRIRIRFIFVSRIRIRVPKNQPKSWKIFRLPLWRNVPLLLMPRFKLSSRTPTQGRRKQKNPTSTPPPIFSALMYIFLAAWGEGKSFISVSLRYRSLKKISKLDIKAILGGGAGEGSRNIALCISEAFPYRTTDFTNLIRSDLSLYITYCF